MPEQSDSVRLAILRVGALEVAIHLLRVVEIVSARPLLAVGAAHEVAGLLAVRGRLFPVLDLHLLLHGVPRAAQAGQFVLIVASGRELVLAVDKLDEVVDTTCDKLIPAPALERGSREAILCGAVLLEKREVALLDLMSLAHRAGMGALPDSILAGAADKP